MIFYILLCVLAVACFIYGAAIRSAILELRKDIVDIKKKLR